jgi:hypothetical protein
MLAELAWTGIVFAGAFYLGGKYQSYGALKDAVKGWFK